MRNTISQKEVAELFSYNPETGELRNKKPRGSRARVGNVAGNVGNHGYLQISINGKHFCAHRLIMKMVFDIEPEEVDHLNHNRSDNRLSNLRASSKKENGKNQKLSKNNTSGFTGVYWKKDKNKWLAQIQVEGKKIYLGSFEKKEDAVAAYEYARIKYGFNENHGK